MGHRTAWRRREKTRDRFAALLKSGDRLPIRSP
jgi:hypothetical protein